MLHPLQFRLCGRRGILFYGICEGNGESVVSAIISSRHELIHCLKEVQTRYSGFMDTLPSEDGELQKLEAQLHISRERLNIIAHQLFIPESTLEARRTEETDLNASLDELRNKQQRALAISQAPPRRLRQLLRKWRPSE